MNSVEFEVARRTLRASQDAKQFVPFYRNVLKPVLEHSIMSVMAGDFELSDERLRTCRAFAKVIRDMEIILNRVILKGESIEKVVKEYMVKQEKEE